MEERKYFNLDLNCLKDNRTFWKRFKSLFSEKSTTSNKIVLIENNKSLNYAKLVSETFFTNVIHTLGVEENYPSLSDLDDTTNPITKIINN